MDSQKINSNNIECEVSDIWKILGKAWSLLILRSLSTKGTTRFNELKRLLPEISNTVLSDRLRGLEKEGLVTKKIYAEVPIKVEYSLTKDARELETILEALGKWIKKRESSTRKK